MSARTRDIGERGLTVLELMVALGTAALLFLAVDAVFSTSSRAARRVEAAADVQQHARAAVELLARELRESSAAEMAIGGPPGARAVVFKSARLAADPTVFCLWPRTRTEPLYHPGCFYWAGAPLPPYTTDPPYAPPCQTATGSPCGTYAPIWQRAIGYYVADGSNGTELRRVVIALSSPDAPLPDPAALKGGTGVALRVERFEVSLVDGLFAVELVTSGAAVGPGPPAPPQRTRLTGSVRPRNGSGQ